MLYTLKLIYDTSKSQHYKESITHCASIQLYVDHSIDSSQTSATELVFESQRDCVFASIVLSDNSAYTVSMIDSKDSSNS
jgi:hypothetical protein